MPLKLDSPINTQTVEDLEVTSFAIDIRTNSLYIGVDLLTSSGDTVSKENVVLIGQETADAIGRANEIASANVYSALKKSLYESVIAKKGISGTIT